LSNGNTTELEFVLEELVEFCVVEVFAESAEVLEESLVFIELKIVCGSDE